MAADAHHELIIIKRHGGGHGEGHHGGAWKIAFADFMTAMMALFLVLWLISATNPKQRIIIAHYFNPVKLAEVSVNKKGLDDPTPGEGGHGGPKSGDNTDRKPKPPPPPVLERRVQLEPTAVQATHDEATLFRDPYAMLSEIAAQTEAANTASNAAKSQALDAQASDTTDPFHDPFSTVPTTEPQQPAPDQSAAASAPPQPAAKTISDDTKASSVQATVPPTVMPPAPPVENDKTLLPSKDIAKNTPQPQPRPAPADKAAADAHANDAEATQLRNEINAAMHMDVVSPGSPNIEVKSTAEGILVSLTDEGSYSMFAVGSAEPQSKTIEVMGKVAELLKSYKGLIVVRGHTDGRPYKSKNYDNWQLSAARAQMAHYMLVRGGLDEKRIDRIEGYADHQLKLTTDPLAAENRRIEILVRKDKP